VTSHNAGDGRPEETAHSDVTEAVTAREQLLEGVMGSIENFVTVDAEWRFTFVNQAAAHMLGRPRDELLGEDLWAYSPAAPDSEIGVQAFKAMNERVSAEATMRSVRQDTWYHCRAFPLADGGLAIYLHDVGDRVRAEHALCASTAETAAQRERLRLARDLHDSVTQALFAASLKAESLVLAGNLAQRERQTIEDVRRLSRGASAQMFLLLLELRSDAIEAIPLGRLLSQLVEATESRVSTDVRLGVNGEAELPESVHVALYRIAQEALSNVARHARAANAWVTLELGRSAVRLEVGDDGAGFDETAVSPQSLGLETMRERAAAAGAEFRLETGPGCQGTRVIVAWHGED
jgi:signal transduction histidine kinase